MTVRTIAPNELAKKRQGGEAVDLIDVRTPAEHGDVHAEGAKNIPLDRLNPSTLLAARGGDASKPIYFICRSGSRAQQACERASAAGFKDVVNVDGGTVAWEAAGLPVIRGERRVISLERQVRIAAGSLVVLGTILGVLVHPYFLALSAFVGAGLVFAGITDTCGMALMLGRLPWNQARGEKGATCSR